MESIKNFDHSISQLMLGLYTPINPWWESTRKFTKVMGLLVIEYAILISGRQSAGGGGTIRFLCSTPRGNCRNKGAPRRRWSETRLSSNILRYIRKYARATCLPKTRQFTLVRYNRLLGDEILCWRWKECIASILRALITYFEHENL